MRITKFGHCCLLVEDEGRRVLTDPGFFTTAQDDVEGITIILITHEHPDHYHLDSLRRVCVKNPQSLIVTNAAVGALLEKEGIPCRILKDGDVMTEQGIALRAMGTTHALIHPALPAVENTGFLIADRLWYPGDAFTDPHCSVDVLALPIAGPWMKLQEATDYAVRLKPRLVFPVHDAILAKPAMLQAHYQRVLGGEGVRFVTLEAGESIDV